MTAVNTKQPRFVRTIDRNLIDRVADRRRGNFKTWRLLALGLEQFEISSPLFLATIMSQHGRTLGLKFKASKLRNNFTSHPTLAAVNKTSCPQLATPTTKPKDYSAALPSSRKSATSSEDASTISIIQDLRIQNTTPTSLTLSTNHLNPTRT